MEVCKNKKPSVTEFNERLKLNGLEPMTSEEIDTMSRFSKAYQMEYERRNQIRKKVKLVLWIIIISIVGVLDILGIEIIEFITKMINK